MITAPAVQKEISYSNNFGEYNAKVVKLITKKARMEFVIKNGCLSINIVLKVCTSVRDA